MDRVKISLIGEGSSDRALVPILRWVIRQSSDVLLVDGGWVDLSRLPSPPRSLRDRIGAALDLAPCDILFVHRDADGAGIERRRDEIQRAAAGSAGTPCVAVVPIRMTEAWLLFDEDMLRQAAGNPLGTSALPMPPLGALESLPNPKSVLREVLLEASGLSGRRRGNLDVGSAMRWVTEHSPDFVPLRALSAFRELETSTATILADLRAGTSP